MKTDTSTTGSAPSVDFNPVASSTPMDPPREPLAPSDQGHCLLAALLRSPDLCHQVGMLDRATGRFTNFPVRNVAAAVGMATAFSAAGNDAYIACAEFATPDNRTAVNASGAWAFWLDIDVGDAKASSGRGYATEDETKAAVAKFCHDAGLPEPTHTVASGSGIHVYWILDAFVAREQWLDYAKKFKALTHALGLRADDTRTTDIASVLRIPGTMNYKYVPPKDVVLLHAADQYIERGVMLSAIEHAHAKHCGGSAEFEEVASPISSSPANIVSIDDAYIEPPNLLRLASALKKLEPDCDEKTWKFHRIGPIAYTARAIPEIHDQLKTLAMRWSSGELRGIPSKKWNTPGCNGLTGKQSFERVWKRFLTDTYTGKRVSLGTIYHHAKEQGWVYTPDHAQGEDGGGEGDDGTF